MAQYILLFPIRFAGLLVGSHMQPAEISGASGSPDHRSTSMLLATSCYTSQLSKFNKAFIVYHCTLLCLIPSSVDGRCRNKSAECTHNMIRGGDAVVPQDVIQPDLRFHFLSTSIPAYLTLPNRPPMIRTMKRKNKGNNAYTLHR